MPDNDRDKQHTDKASVNTEQEKQLLQDRQSKVAGFHLHLDLDGEFGEPTEPVRQGADAAADPSASVAAPVTDGGAVPLGQIGEPTVGEDVSALERAPESADTASTPVALGEREAATSTDDTKITKKRTTKKKEGARQAFGCVGGLVYVLGVLAISGIMAFFILAGAIDMMGINKSEALVDVTIPDGASTEQVASILKENKLISQPLVFRLFSKLTHADGSYQPGVFTLSGSLGYKGIIEALQSAAERATVDVTFPEGLTVLDVAQKLEDNGVCNRDEFLWTLAHGDFSDYDFMADVPQVGEGTDHPYRIYRLEGYLFPDTYTFYVGGSPESAVRKFLDNFDAKVDTAMRTAIKARGIAVDEAVTMASILQQEADNKTDMTRVARVFWNRLDSDDFPHLQSDVTTLYADRFFDALTDDSPISAAYSTYACEGLPTGAICNPGRDALNAVINPSTEDSIIGCYYFATDTSADPTVTYYSETYAEHVAICQRYGIGIHG